MNGDRSVVLLIQCCNTYMHHQLMEQKNTLSAASQKTDFFGWCSALPRRAQQLTRRAPRPFVQIPWPFTTGTIAITMKHILIHNSIA